VFELHADIALQIIAFDIRITVTPFCGLYEILRAKVGIWAQNRLQMLSNLS
jgi:hypothetical protein